ncbi:hypothetical protein LWI29_001140 [Acer saccharum]|uniref:Chromo domain-containing protein n=1 Tax=Acer saccharum TaxID=4024 RepID=A0AA39RFR2_ACESA|nr:hypothetical protein LWI29_001140 [Acer saccharum]
MRVRGNIRRISTIVLVDSGSTHNFINEALAKKVGLQPVQGGQFEMKFKVAEAEVILQGESCPADQIVGELKFIKEARKGNKGTIFPTPQAVLDRRQRKNEDEILIHWKGLSPTEATWENLAAMQKQFPDHSLEDKVDF